MEFRQNGSGWGSFQGKTKEQRKREELGEKIARLETSVQQQTETILSRKTLREADFNEIVRAKRQLETDTNELGKLKRQLSKLEDNLK
jgi:valyl-tRNA synthetase